MHNSTQAAHLTLEEASAALCAMAAGRCTIPPVDELRAMVTERRLRLSPATARLIADIESANRSARNTSDPIAQSLADLMATVLTFAREQIEAQER